MVDGTPCRPDTVDICVSGECKVEGTPRERGGERGPEVEGGGSLNSPTHTTALPSTWAATGSWALTCGKTSAECVGVMAAPAKPSRGSSAQPGLEPVRDPPPPAASLSHSPLGGWGRGSPHHSSQDQQLLRAEGPLGCKGPQKVPDMMPQVRVRDWLGFSVPKVRQLKCPRGWRPKSLPCPILRASNRVLRGQAPDPPRRLRDPLC